jgi:hypothetical protein
MILGGNSIDLMADCEGGVGSIGMAEYEVSESWILGVVVVCTGETYSYNYVGLACCCRAWSVEQVNTYWRMPTTDRHRAGPVED